jgi:hypothetical protein
MIGISEKVDWLRLRSEQNAGKRHTFKVIMCSRKSKNILYKISKNH